MTPKDPGTVRFSILELGRRANNFNLPSEHFISFAACILLGCLIVASFIFLTIWAGLDQVNGSNESDSSGLPAAQNVSIPSRPSVPGYYAKFTTSNNLDGWPFDTHELIFTYEHLNVKLITMQEVPDLVAKGAVEFGKKPTYGPEHAILTRPRGAKGFAANWSQRPYIIYGDVAIDCGPLVDRDVGFFEGVLDRGEFHRLKIYIDSDAPRGPPRAIEGLPKLVRTVYVVGAIQSYKGPDLFNHSLMANGILDLRPTRSDTDGYVSAMDTWQEKLDRMASELRISTDALKSYAGRSVNIADGQVRPTAADLRKWMLSNGLELSEEPSPRESSPAGERPPDRPVEIPHIDVP